MLKLCIHETSCQIYTLFKLKNTHTHGLKQNLTMGETDMHKIVYKQLHIKMLAVLFWWDLFFRKFSVSLRHLRGYTYYLVKAEDSILKVAS